jgi:hypothetical protein
MKKLLFLAVLGLGAMSLKGNVSLTPDNQVHVFSSWVSPVPAVIQSSPLYTMVSTMMTGQLGPIPQMAVAPAAPQYRTAAQPVRPALPNVTSATSTYNANAPAAGSASGGDSFGATSKVLRGQ